MPKRADTRPKERDENLTAFRIMQEATGESDQPKPPKNPAAVALGRLGGKKGGKARAASLTPEQRKEIARKAAAARWNTLKEQA